MSGENLWSNGGLTYSHLTRQRESERVVGYKQNYPGSVASYNTGPGNEECLFYNAPEATRGLGSMTL